MADYQQALQELIRQRQLAQPRPEDVAAADEQNRLGLLLNNLFKSQASVGNIGGKPTESAGVDFQDYGKLASDQMKQKNLLANQQFEQGLQGQQAQMGIDKFSQDQQSQALQQQAQQFIVGKQPQQFQTEQDFKKAQIEQIRNEIDGGNTPAGKDLMEARRVEKLRASIPYITDPVKKKVATDTVSKYDARQQATRNSLLTKDLTPGQMALDKEYAPQYEAWTTNGKPLYEKNVKRLEEAKQKLQVNDLMSGNFVGRLPEGLRSTESRVAEQDVREAAQGALKATLGSQFTEKEGERIMKNAYDPTLPPAENIRKINLALEEIKANATNQESKAKLFENSGSLKNYKSDASKSQNQPKSIKQNGHTYILNESTGKYE